MTDVRGQRQRSPYRLPPPLIPKAIPDLQSFLSDTASSGNEFAALYGAVSTTVQPCWRCQWNGKGQSCSFNQMLMKIVHRLAHLMYELKTSVWFQGRGCEERSEI